MEMPTGPPSLGGSAPPPERSGEAELSGSAEVPESAEVPHDRERLLEDEVANRRLVATTAALALVAVAIMIGIFVFTDESASDEPEPGLAAPATFAPTATTVPADGSPAAPAAIDPLELSGVVREVQAFVAEERGLEFESDVDVELLDREAFEERAREHFDAAMVEDAEAVRERVALFQAVGIWPAGADPIPLLADLEASGRVAFYDVEADAMVIGAGSLTPLVEATLAHELTHALDDQHFDLDRPELATVIGEPGLGFSSVVEGDARRIELAFQATMTDDERSAMVTETQALVAAVDLSSVPPVLVAEQQFPHEVGQAFVQAVFEEGGPRALDRLFRRGPTSSEQLLEPDDWFEGDRPVTVDVPEADGEATGDGVAGQFLLDLIAREDRPAGTSIPEWDGDRYVLWAEGEQICARIAVQGDLDGFEAQLASWASQVGGEVTNDGTSVLATACH